MLWLMRVNSQDSRRQVCISYTAAQPISHSTASSTAQRSRPMKCRISPPPARSSGKRPRSPVLRRGGLKRPSRPHTVSAMDMSVALPRRDTRDRRRAAPEADDGAIRTPEEETLKAGREILGLLAVRELLSLRLIFSFPVQLLRETGAGSPQ